MGRYWGVGSVTDRCTFRANIFLKESLSLDDSEEGVLFYISVDELGGRINLRVLGHNTPICIELGSSISLPHLVPVTLRQLIVPLDKFQIFKHLYK